MKRRCYLVVGALALTSACHAQGIAQKCSGLTSTDSKQLPNPSTVLISASLRSASAAQGNTPALPEHCEVMGKINERVGENSQKYAIHFHLRLPTNWNGRFFFEGGGGANGNLGNALGNLQGQQRTNALALGYAVVSQDAGHDNRTNNDTKLNGALTFGFDPQARLDYGYNSYDQVTQGAKALIKEYYGRSPERSYYVGCSEGGREGMMMSQRFPSYYDGILACSPGLRLPKAAAYGEAWNAQALAEVARAAGVYDRFGQPFLAKTFTDEDLSLASNAVLAACDNLDGLEDGIVGNFSACSHALVGPKLAALVCKGPKRANCLSAAQVTALEKMFDGPKNSKGDLLYADWPWDSGIGGKAGEAYNQGWRAWRLGAYDAANNSSISLMLGSGAIAAVFSTPPIPVPASGGAPAEFLLGVNFDGDAARIYAETGKYTKSSWDFMMASSTDLSVFKNRRGKLLIVHGVSDPVFSINDTIAWWNEVNKVNNGAAGDFVRLFAVPGMNHCAGGPATDQFDAFTALVNWVEKDMAPDKIIATAGSSTPWPGRTRPLCVYPKFAHYAGTGSIEEAGNFVCQ